MGIEQTSAGTGRHTGRKVWYGFVIALCGLMVIISAAGIVGSWVVGKSLSDTAVRLLDSGQKAASMVGTLAGVLERNLSDIQDLSSQVSKTTQKIGENVTDKGVVLTLLPEDRERQLMDKIQAVVDTLTGVKTAVASAIELYRAVDGIPFINLPKPATDTVDKLEAAINELQAGVNELVASIRDFRAGVAGAIERITALAERINSRIDEARSNLKQLQVGMAGLQQRFAELQQKAPTFFTILSLVFMLFFLFVLYTQVVVIQTFVRRWRSLNAPAAVLPPPETPLQTTPPVLPLTDTQGGEPPLTQGGETSD